MKVFWWRQTILESEYKLLYLRWDFFLSVIFSQISLNIIQHSELVIWITLNFTWLKSPLKQKKAPVVLTSAFIAGAGLEPAASGLWARRAANCSTPRRILRIYNKNWIKSTHKGAKSRIILKLLIFLTFCKTFCLIYLTFGFIYIIFFHIERLNFFQNF